ncbi:Fe-Mn family superoxide dismutase [Bradyrhizobium japonicum]|uniref:Fe-Mn family superoxide dismutase n=1 Tax=Bradyrhizobium japonicum TaxID=375 RepID=UPI0035D630DC
MSAFHRSSLHTLPCHGFARPGRCEQRPASLVGRMQRSNDLDSEAITSPTGATPILALDIYEHSYHIDCGAKAASYVDVFMEAINWSNVQRAFHGAQS